ncbi:MAG: tyrosine-type recombinase/integrase [Anaerolineales bacterium]
MGLAVSQSGYNTFLVFVLMFVHITGDHRVLKAANLPRIRFHDLRHTAASLMLNHGVPVIVVSKILGHAKPSTTMDIYGHLIHEMQSEAAKIMDELVTPLQLEISKAIENVHR